MVTVIFRNNDTIRSHCSSCVYYCMKSFNDLASGKWKEDTDRIQYWQEFDESLASEKGGRR